MPGLHLLGPVSPLTRGHAATDLAHLFALIDGSNAIRSTRLRLAAQVPLLAALDQLDHVRRRLAPDDPSRLAPRLRQSMIRQIERESRARGAAHRRVIDALDEPTAVDAIPQAITRLRGLNPGDGWTHRTSRLRRPRPSARESEFVHDLRDGRYDDLAGMALRPRLTPNERRLARTGVHVGRDGHRAFVGIADERSALVLPPSLPLLIALSRRPATLTLAEGMRSRLRRAGQDGAWAWLAAGQARAGLVRKADHSRARIRHRSWQDEASRLMCRAYAERGEFDRAAACIEPLRSADKASRAWLELASDRALAADSDGVHAMLLRIRDPRLACARALVSVQLALAQGRIQRAAAKLARIQAPRLSVNSRRVGPARWCPPSMRTPSDYDRMTACALVLALHDRGVRARLHARSGGALGLEAAQSLLDRPELLDRMLAPLALDPMPAFERAALLPVPFADLLRARLIHSWHRSVRSRAVVPRVERLLAHTRPVQHPAEAFIAGIFDGAGALSLPRRASPVLRAFYDEGRSVGPHVDRRRRSLLNVSRAVLRSAFEPDRPSSAVLASRIRCARNLARGGYGLAVADSLARVLGTTTEVGRDAVAHLGMDSSVRESVWRQLLTLAPHRALSLASRRFFALSRGGRRGHAIVEALVHARALPAEVVEAWTRLERRGRRMVGLSRFARWWSDLSRSFFDRLGRPITAALIDKLAGPELAHHLNRRPSEWVEQIVLERRALFDRPLAVLPKALGRRPQTLMWLESLDAIRRSRPWSAARMATAVGRLARNTSDIDQHRAKEAIRRLRLPDALWDRALRGAPWVEAFDAHPTAALPGHHRLVWLHKGRDLFRWLRFADDVRCCFNSDSWHYEHGLCTWRDIRDLWLDPLSFCLEVRTGAAADRGGGFIFGGLGSTDGQPVLLLNGIYLRRRHRPLRLALLALIEQGLCRPLGLRRIAIANRFGGCGALPEHYERQTRRLCRLRALTAPSGPYRYVYDDIGERVNEIEVVDHLYWSVLDEPKYLPARPCIPERPNGLTLKR